MGGSGGGGGGDGDAIDFGDVDAIDFGSIDVGDVAAIQAGSHLSLSLFLSPLFPLFIWIFANCSCANSLFLCFVFLFRDGQKFGESKFEIIDICQAYTTLRNEMSFLACVLI